MTRPTGNPCETEDGSPISVMPRPREDRYRRLVETVPQAIAQVDASGTLTFCNGAYCRMLGYTASELLGKKLWELHEPGTERETLRRRFPALMAEQPAPASSMMRKATKDGRAIDVQVDWNYQRDDGGCVIGLVAAITDVTERLQAEHALRRAQEELELRVRERTADLARTIARLQAQVSERIHMEQVVRQQSRHLDAFFQHSLTPLALLDRQFRFLRVNAAYAQADFRRVEDFPGHCYFEFHPSEEARAIFEGVVRTANPYQAAARPFVYPDHPEWGVTYWDWSIVPLLDECQEVEQLVFSLCDVTDRKRAELELQALNESLRHQSEQVRRLPARSALAKPRSYGRASVASGHEARLRQRTRVLLADDHQIFRQGLAHLLIEMADIEIVGEAADGEEAIDLARRLKPDVILMDISMPRLDGIGATQRIKDELPDVRIIGLSMHDAELGSAICAAGASLYLSKHGPSEDLLKAIRSREEGGA